MCVVTELYYAMATLAVSPEQLRTLQAIVDTVIAPMTAEETRAAMEVHGGRHGRSAEEVRLLCESAGSGAGVDGAVLGTLLRHAKPAEQDEMKLLLSVFGNRFGNFALTGNFSAFADMTQAQREEAFYGLSESMISLKRKAFLQLKVSRMTGVQRGDRVGVYGIMCRWAIVCVCVCVCV